MAGGQDQILLFLASQFYFELVAHSVVSATSAVRILGSCGTQANIADCASIWRRAQASRRPSNRAVGLNEDLDRDAESYNRGRC